MKSALIVLVLVLVAGFVFSFQPQGQLIADQPETITVPVTAHLIRDDSSLYTSTRTEGNVRALFGEVNRIWEPAGVAFEVVEVREIRVSGNAIPDAINGNTEELDVVRAAGSVNIFFVQSLNGINGLALPYSSSALVADFTTVNDFRTTAHELGHLLGLVHVPDPERLMARGRNGELLTVEEIATARENLLA